MKNKLFIALVIPFVIFTSLCCNKSIATYEVCNLTFNEDNKKVAPGDTIELILRLSDVNNENGIVGVDANIEWDDNIFENVSWEECSNYESLIDIGNTAFSLLRKDLESTKSNEDVIKLKMSVKSSAVDGEYPITIKDIIVSDGEESLNINDVVTNISVDGTKPTCEVTSVQTLDSLILNINARDDSGIKEVLVNGFKVSLDENGQGKYVEKLDNGNTSKQFTITVTDNVGNEYSKLYSCELLESLPDLDGNGMITQNDAIIVLRYVAACKSQTVAKKHPNWAQLTEDKKVIADVDKNRIITQNDAIKILRYVAAHKSSTVAQKHPDWLKL